MIEATALVIDVTVPCPLWVGACADAAAVAETAARLALRHSGAPSSAQVDVTLADDETQRTLNRTWRGKDTSTNVLAFPAADPAVPVPEGAPLLLGDVILAYETVAREAVEQDKPLPDHLRHLVVHGVLHLLGCDHIEVNDATDMETREIAILAQLGVSNPYRDII